MVVQTTVPLMWVHNIMYVTYMIVQTLVLCMLATADTSTTLPVKHKLMMVPVTRAIMRAA